MGLFNKVVSIIDPGGNIQNIRNLFTGSGGSGSPFPTGGYAPAARSAAPNVQFSQSAATYKDWRVRISLADPALFYDPGTVQQPVFANTGGVIFPYTPQVQITHMARYSDQALTHSNYRSYFYDGSEVQNITISGEFTVQNLQEGQYLLAAIYFLRSATKMFFGSDPNAGNPPPLVFLDGYGDFIFPHVSCVLTSFTHTMPDNVNYVEIPINPNVPASGSPATTVSTGQVVRLPTTSTISVMLQPVYSRRNVRENFTLGKFARGELLTNRGGFM